MREFDHDQKIYLFSQIILNAFVIILIFVFYDFIISNLPNDIVSVCRNAFIAIFGFNLLIMVLQFYRYKKSRFHRLEKIKRYCKKSHVSYDRISFSENGTVSIFNGDQKVLELP